MPETIREYLTKYCEDRGMFRDQAEAVLARVEEHPATAAMKGRWADSIEDYRPVLVLLTMATNIAAVEWIEANAPEAWFRPLFMNETVS